MFGKYNIMKKLLAITALACFLFSCGSGIKIKGVETAVNVNLHGYKSFGFYSVKAVGDTIPFLFNERLGILKSAIVAELSKKGFVQTNTNPDLMINIGIQVSEEVQIRQTQFGQDGPFYMGQTNYKWKSEIIEAGHYRNGSVTIHAVDARQVRLVWQATAEGIIPVKESQLIADVKTGMFKLFERFPLIPN
jgi:Domain of unknown function (DUF4136)